METWFAFQKGIFVHEKQRAGAALGSLVFGQVCSEGNRASAEVCCCQG